MTNRTLAESYIVKAEKRLKALAVLKSEDAHSDVIREAQEVVELAMKGMLRAIGVEPPKYHDVGGLLSAHAEKIPGVAPAELSRAAAVSKRLRKERELSFYGDIDFIPTEEYTAEDAERAYEDAGWTVRLARGVIDRFPR